jgi:hypothetical protein
MFFKKYNIGAFDFIISNYIKSLDFDDKIIYLTPCNAVTKEINTFILKNYNPKSILFIDKYKKDSNIITSDNMSSKYDYLLLYSPVYHKEIVAQLPYKNNLFLIYYDIKNHLNIAKYNKLSLVYSFFNKTLFFNTYYSSKYFLANKLNIMSKDEKDIYNLKDIHKDKRAFIIGNGPSLKISDLDMLKDEITFASNKIFLAYDETTWRPTYYSVEDSYDMSEYYEKIRDLKGSIKLLPIKHLLNYKKIDDAIYYPLIQNPKNKYKCSNNLMEGIYPGCSVTYSMLQLALYMGITKIYLIGVDFSYFVPVKYNNNAVIYQEDEQNHFHKDYRHSGDKWLEPNEECQIKALQSAKQFTKNNNVEIYNASRKTKLEVFDKIDFDSLFSEN